jgi:NADPH:quinone reductase-like Zn-dependent oxidoreductase
MAAGSIDIPKTQRALRWVRVSDTDPFEWSDSVPVVQPSQLADHDVLLENHAAALNPIDYKITSMNFSNTKLPACTGYDISGRIIAVGKAVTHLQVGDEAFGYLSLDSSNGGGAFQQYSVGHADGLVKKPSNITHTDAAALGVAYLSALVSLNKTKTDHRHCSSVNSD